MLSQLLYAPASLDKDRLFDQVFGAAAIEQPIEE
jgi:hypothetical protein